ncbi:hypothetical protein EI94DRAFT_1815427 [Lactarius quietus]|nr:hypothetical protein EI94DRAFT_1815427 [Lactarius quietus]
MTRALVSTTNNKLEASSIRHRILSDPVYSAKIGLLPRARISIFRAEVKKRCMAAVALMVNVHDSPFLIADLIDKQLNDNYNYIFPRHAGISLHEIDGQPTDYV